MVNDRFHYWFGGIPKGLFPDEILDPEAEHSYAGQVLFAGNGKEGIEGNFESCSIDIYGEIYGGGFGAEFSLTILEPQAEAFLSKGGFRDYADSALSKQRAALPAGAGLSYDSCPEEEGKIVVRSQLSNCPKEVLPGVLDGILKAYGGIVLGALQAKGVKADNTGFIIRFDEMEPAESEGDSEGKDVSSVIGEVPDPDPSSAYSPPKPFGLLQAPPADPNKDPFELERTLPAAFVPQLIDDRAIGLSYGKEEIIFNARPAWLFGYRGEKRQIERLGMAGNLPVYSLHATVSPEGVAEAYFSTDDAGYLLPKLSALGAGWSAPKEVDGYLVVSKKLERSSQVKGALDELSGFLAKTLQEGMWPVECEATHLAMPLVQEGAGYAGRMEDSSAGLLRDYLTPKEG